MAIKLTTILVPATCILIFSSCQHVVTPDAQFATVVTAKQATVAAHDEIDRWIGMTYHYYHRKQYIELKDIYKSMIVIDSLTEIAVRHIEENKVSIALDSLSYLKRNIIRHSGTSRGMQRDWRDSMITDFDTLQPFVYKEEAILHLTLMELMMIETLARSYTICDDSEPSSLFDIGNGKVVCFIENKTPSVYGGLDSIHILSGWLNRQPLKPEQYQVQRSPKQMMITITLPEGIDKSYMEAGFQYSYQPDQQPKPSEHYVIFIGTLE